MLLPLLAGQHRRLLLAAFRAISSTSSSAALCQPQTVLRLPATVARQQRHLLAQLPRQPIRWSGGGHGGPRKMVIQPSRYQWDHFWDDIHFYALLGIVPCSLVALYLYIFVGPAELTEIPEGYEPQAYEYHRHPMTRWFAWLQSHYFTSEQEKYEKRGAYLTEEYLRIETRKEFKQIKQQEALLGDYRGYYFVPINPRPVSQHHLHRQIEDMSGDLPHGFQSEDPRELPSKIDDARHQF